MGYDGVSVSPVTSVTWLGVGRRNVESGRTQID